MREMKDSGVDWIGEIPENWEIKSIKSVFNIGRGRVIAKTELDEGVYPIYSSQTKNKGIMGYINTYDFDVTQLTWTTDGANAGTVFLREGKHNCTNVCGTLQPKFEDLDMHFAEHAVGYVSFFNKRPDTNGYKIMNNEMSNIQFALPPYENQKRIAKYLDQKVSAIDKIIEKTMESIEEYKKLKQSIITEAVTKGLNPGVKMKDSGIEWIGEIPEHWKIAKIVNSFSQIGSGTTPLTSNSEFYSNGEVNWIQSGDINGGYLYSSSKRISNDALVAHSVLKVYEPDFIIIAMYGASIANVSISKISGCTNQACCVLANTQNDIEYMFSVLKSAKDYLVYLASGGTQPNISQEKIKQLKIPIPPINEQKEITSFLNKKISTIEYLISLKEKAVENLITYKKSLIYEVVTGKKEIPTQEVGTLGL